MSDYRYMWDTLVCWLEKQRRRHHKGEMMSISESVYGEKFYKDLINKMSIMEKGFSVNFDPDDLDWHFVKYESLPEKDGRYLVSRFNNPYINNFEVMEYSVVKGFKEPSVVAWTEIPEGELV